MTQTNQADPELPYLSDLLQPEQFKHERFNLVVAPCHSGKSTAARTLITDFGFPRESVLYLIDTTAGKEAILAHEKAQTLPYEWIEQSEPFRRIHNMYDDQFVTMTYHQFGDLWHEDPTFLFRLRLIICDEMHNLLKFERIQDNQNHALELYDGLGAQKSCTWAITALAQLAKCSFPASPLLIAITATPDQVIHAFKKHDIPYHTYDYRGKVHYDKTQTRLYYSDFKSIAANLHERAIIYVPTIGLMQNFAEVLDNGERKIACLWSVHQKDIPMSEEQLTIRDEILKTERIPADIDILLINAAYETSINIRNEDFNTVIIHSGNPDVQIQVRGRLRHDIDCLYIHDKAHEHVTDYLPEEYYDRPLFYNDREELVHLMNMTNENNRLIKWPTLAKQLRKEGFVIKEGRLNNCRYYRILRIPA